MKKACQKNKYGLMPFLVFALASGAFAYWTSLPKKESAGQDRSDYVSINVKNIATVETSRTEQKVVGKRMNDERFVFSKIVGDKETKFVSARRIKDSLAYFAPLETIRRLGKLKEEEKKTFGLAPAKSSLKVLSASGEALLELDIGNKTYGSNNIYALDRKTGEGIIVLSEVFEDFDSAEARLIERNIFNVSLEDADTAEITKKSGQQVSLVKKRDPNKDATWALANNPAEVKANAKTWLEKVERLHSEKFRFDKNKSDLTQGPEFALLLKTGSKESRLMVYRDGDAWLGFVDFLDAFVQLPADRMVNLSQDAQAL